MKVNQLLALGIMALASSSCSLLGNAFNGGPSFAGSVEGTQPAAANYGLALVRFTTLGGASQEQSETAAFATSIAINGGTGGFTGFLVPNIDVGSDTERYYKFMVFEDKTGDGKYDLDASGNNGEKDKALADSTNGKTASGNRFLVYSKLEAQWTTSKTLKAGWNLITDVNKDTTTVTTIGRGDDLITQSLGGITITY
jgi:hypothetical protein